MYGIGLTELIIILVVVLLIFGPGKLPEIGAGLGKGIRNFKKATNEEHEKLAAKSEAETKEAKQAKGNKEEKEEAA